MTAIVGLKFDGDVWMGGDSWTEGNGIGFKQVNPKVFRHGELLIGSCGQGRAPQIIQYCATAPDWPEGMDALEYLVRVWVPVVREVIEAHGHQKKNENADELNGAFLVATRGRLFFLGGDWTFDEYAEYGACGSGEDVAYGALYAACEHFKLENAFGARNIIEAALNAAAKHCPGVAPPFHIEKL